MNRCLVADMPRWFSAQRRFDTVWCGMRPVACVAVLCMCAVTPVMAQDLGGLFKQAVKKTVETAVDRAVGQATSRAGEKPENTPGQANGTARSRIGESAIGVPDDSPAARDAAIARLRGAGRGEVCADAGAMGRVYGTTCNSREFPAPPILSAPTFAWQTKPGWWGVWSPFLVGNRMLTGSCNNDDNAGISALDLQTGKTLWRIASVCAEGNRRGTSGNVAFYELPSGRVLLAYARDDGKPVDYYVIDPAAGRIVDNLKPAANVTLRGLGGTFTGVNQSKQDGVSNLIGFNASLDQVLWRNREFQLAMEKDDSRYLPTFSPAALTDGILLLTARSKDQADPPTRQLQAIDMRTGQTLWRNTAQPVAERGNGKAWRSDDGNPMVVGGKAIIRVQGLSGAAAYGHVPTGDALRAFDPRSGKVAWTTNPIADGTIGDRVGAGDMLVVDVARGGAHELRALRLADGRPEWRRPIGAKARLLASSGGVFYLSERIPAADGKGGSDYRLQGLDARSGTLLWSTVLPGHNLDFDGDWGIVPDPRRGGSQGPSWRIGRDGAIYGVTLTGAFKLQ